MESVRCPTIAIAIERGTPAYSRLRSCARPQAGDAMDELAANRKKAAALTRQVGVDFGAALTVALAYIGDRLGIFRAMAGGECITSQQLAEHTRLSERYLREWASTMAAAGYLDYDASEGTFR